MPKCRPVLDIVSQRASAGLKVPGNRRRVVASGKFTAKSWSRQHDAAPLGADPGKQVFDRHAALLDNSRLSQSANRIRRAMIVRKLQRDHGTRYVQRLIEHISRRRATPVRAKIPDGPARDKNFSG